MMALTVLVLVLGSLLASARNTHTGLPATTVFSPGLAKGYADFRIPSIVITNKGTLVAFAEARTTGADASTHQIGTRRSTDGGKTWGPLGFAAGSNTHWVGNPTALFTDDNKIMLIYVKHNKTCSGDCGIGNGMVTSSDDGLTFSKDVDLSKMFGHASGSLPGPGAALQLRAGGPHAGRILVPSHHRGYQEDYVTISDDGGVSWRTISTDFPKMDEAQMAQLVNGTVVLNMRHESAPDHVRAVSFSHNGGDTWSNITYDDALISPTCQASIATIAGATYFSNPASKTARDNITIRRMGETTPGDWPDALIVQPAATSGYTCLVDQPIADGTGGILFEDVGNTISFAAFPLDF